MESPLLADNLENLWSGQWAISLEDNLGASLNDNKKIQYLRRALMVHRKRFAQASTGRRETLLVDIESGLRVIEPNRMATSKWDRGILSLHNKVVSIYRRHHESLIKERSEIISSLGEVRFGARGEAALDGLLLVKCLQYCAQVERRNGSELIDRAKIILQQRADQFLVWLQQERRAEQDLVKVIWEDWSTSGGLGYEMPEIVDAEISDSYAALVPWYQSSFLVGIASQISTVVSRKEPLQLDSEVPANIKKILFLRADRPRYEKALELWKTTNDASITALAIKITPEADVALVLGVDPSSGNVLSPSGKNQEDLRRTMLYRRFQQQFGAVSSECNGQIATMLESLSPEEKALLSTYNSIFSPQ